MRPIEAKAKSVRELLQVKYSIDYYQREYRWEAKQVRELIDDLSDMFVAEYEPGMATGGVQAFPHYFLGSIIISERDGESFIVDGQQRLTTLTLLLMFLRSLQRGRDDSVSIDSLIFSDHFGKKTFNLEVDERDAVMRALFDGLEFDPSAQSESVQNLVGRYQDIAAYFPSELRDEALPHFIYWLIGKVHLVEISAYTDEEAYTIFETMNDRGLSLSPTEMLKGYLLANMDPQSRTLVNERWRHRVKELSDRRDDHGSDFFKAWLRSQYADKIREGRKGATPEDFDKIGTEFHRWLRNERKRLGLNSPDDFYKLVQQDFDFYSRQFLRIRDAQHSLTDGLQHIFYNAGHGFTLQEMLLLAPLRPGDSESTIKIKISLVAQFVDIWLTRRIWNSKSIAYSTMRNAMFLVMKDIRGQDPQPLVSRLHDRLCRQQEQFHSNFKLKVHQQNRAYLHRVLARMTDYVETASGQNSRYLEFVSRGKPRYEVEHIWANDPERHQDEFEHPSDFASERNRIGGLLLLPKPFNAAFGSLPYEKKLSHYNSQNLLARSLHPMAYERNPGFVKFVHQSGLPFRPYERFTRAEIEARGDLYQQLAEQVWNPKHLLEEVSQ